MICNLCPRKCNAIREEHKGYGFCRMPKDAYVSRIALHLWEEPIVSGKQGTVAVFFTGCTLNCIYCQNREISQENLGKRMTVEEIGDKIIELLKSGGETLSFITPTHYSHLIREIIDYVKPKVPVIYNTSGYESVSTLRTLEGYIDVYLPDLKYSNNELGKLYSKADHYFDTAIEAIDEMIRQTGKPIINSKGIIEKGTLVRNLVLPNHTRNSIEIIEFLDKHYEGKILFSLMGQYVPYGLALSHKNLCRKITKREYQKVLMAFENSNLDGFCQELSSADEKYIPTWDI